MCVLAAGLAGTMATVAFGEYVKSREDQKAEIDNGCKPGLVDHFLQRIRLPIVRGRLKFDSILREEWLMGDRDACNSVNPI